MNESDAEKAAGSRLDYDLMMAEEYILSDVEKNFILSCERGDIPGVKKSVSPRVLVVSLQVNTISMLTGFLRSTTNHPRISSTSTALIQWIAQHLFLPLRTRTLIWWWYCWRITLKSEMLFCMPYLRSMSRLWRNCCSGRKPITRKDNPMWVVSNLSAELPQMNVLSFQTELGISWSIEVYLHHRHNATDSCCTSQQLWNTENLAGSWCYVAYAARCQVSETK